MEPVSRRTFIRDGALASAAAVAALGWPEFLARAVGSERGLTAARGATFRALLNAFDAGLGGIDVAAREREFGGWHARADDDGKTYAETLLDMLEEAPDGGRFSRLPPRTAYDTLQGWHRARTREERAFEARDPGLALVSHPAGATTSEKLAADTAAIRQTVERLRRERGPSAFEQDPATGLVRTRPPAPKEEPRIWASPLGTTLGRRRYLAHGAWNLAVSMTLTPQPQ